jgi:hypothetical protein
MRKYYREPAAYNSVFAGSYASPNAFGTSQIRKTIPKMSLRSILGIGAADERKASAMIVIIGFQGYRHAKRHFGYQADERLKPKLPLRGTSLIRRPVSCSLRAKK